MYVLKSVKLWQLPPEWGLLQVKVHSLMKWVSERAAHMQKRGGLVEGGEWSGEGGGNACVWSERKGGSAADLTSNTKIKMQKKKMVRMLWDWG